MARPVWVSLLVLTAALAGCPKKSDPPLVVREDAGAPGVAADGARGKELVLQYQCNRCHDGTGHPAAAQDKHCVHCHKDIVEDRFGRGTPATIAKWKPRVKDLADAPSLAGAGKRFTRAWIEQYLLHPTHLRPHLKAYMPRLAMDAKDAKDLAAYLAPDEAPSRGAPPELAGADLGRGRKVLDSKGCGSCHVFSGVAPLENSPPPPMDGRLYAAARTLAPDLRVTRERITAARVVAWLANPKLVDTEAAMPRIPLTEQEIRDVAAYVLTAELGPVPSPVAEQRLPVLTRKVTYKEVDDAVFHRTCWHCHSEPDYAIGDGGPGNSGGLGFKPRGLNLSSYEGITAGYVDDHGERQSVFAKDASGVPRLVRALVARHEEEEGNAETGEVRGMPLGYEPLSREDIQLVETWIAQGRPR